MQSNWASFTDKFDRQPTCFVFHGLKLLKFKGEHKDRFSQDLSYCPPRQPELYTLSWGTSPPHAIPSTIPSPLAQHTDTHTLRRLPNNIVFKQTISQFSFSKKIQISSLPPDCGHLPIQFPVNFSSHG